MVVRTGRHWANANLERENFTVFNRQSKSIPTDSPGFKDSWVKPNQWENSPRYLQITPPTVSHWSSKNWPKHIYVWPIVLTLYISQHKSWQVKQDSPYLIISSFFQILPSLFFRCERSLLTRSKQLSFRYRAVPPNYDFVFHLFSFKSFIGDSCSACLYYVYSNYVLTSV